jgi:CRISPR system Cascade subunit CasC
MKKLYIDFHVIQTVPPSCVNRDDTGSPKTAVYGGVKRARVSSQSWKAAMRRMFKENFNEAELGVRTKRIIEMVAQEICKLDAAQSEENAKSLAEKIINLAGVTTKDGQAKALFFIGKKQAENLAELILGNSDATKKEAQIALNAGTSIDVALFGRMVADDPVLNADACSQVAHAISTHRVDNEYDYFTAMDDLSPEDSAGAGMIGTVEFNSSTLYRYATIAVHELRCALGNDMDALAKAVKEFARAFVLSMPDGKQNTFANRTLPDAVVIAVRSDQPVNLVGAFETPVKGEGYAAKSVEAFEAYSAKVYQTFGEPNIGYTVGGANGSLSEVLGKLEEQTREWRP